jgi:hypothetical protein
MQRVQAQVPKGTVARKPRAEVGRDRPSPISVKKRKKKEKNYEKNTEEQHIDS